MLPDLPVKYADSRHLPEYAMHIAPWTNASMSTSSGNASRMRRMSFNVVSRASMMRLAPMSAQARAAAPFVTFACVLTCRSTSGAYLRNTENTPRSLTIAPSAPTSAIRRAYSGKAAMSSSSAYMLTVTYSFFPRSCTYAAAERVRPRRSCPRTRAVRNGRPPDTRRPRRKRARNEVCSCCPRERAARVCA